MLRRLALLAVLLMIAPGCAPCSEKKLSEADSPDKMYVAALFVRNCGATTPYVFHVNLRASSESFRPNLDGTMKTNEVFVISRHRVDLHWKDARTLIVECGDCPPDVPIRIEKVWKDVNVYFQPKEQLTQARH